MEYAQCDLMLQRISESLKERTYFKTNAFGTTLSSYLAAKSWLERRIRTVSTQSTSATRVPQPTSLTSFHTTISLERLRFPRFNGNQRDWEIFKEKFTSLIINDSAMDPIIKFAASGELFGRRSSRKIERNKGHWHKFLNCVGVSLPAL